MKKVKETKKPIAWDFKDKIKKTYSSTWYIALIGVFLGLMSFAYFIIKSWSFMALLVVVLLSIILYINTPAKNIHYTLDRNEIFVNETQYLVSNFKSFGLIQNKTGHHSIILIPKKRFSPALSLDFDDKNGEQIVDFFGYRLPMQKIDRNFIDKIVDKIGL